MKTLVEKLKAKNLTIYQKVAREFGTSELYVGQIARGWRKPQRGMGLKIKQRLEQIANDN